jgi:hypothetical protein
MEVQVHEYAWMWQRLGLSLAECRVFAFIYGLTKSKKYGGYDGSKRQLAAMLGLSVSRTKNVLDILENRGLIVFENEKWKGVLSENGSVLSENESVLSENESVLSENSPHTPLYNNINNKNKAAMREINFQTFWYYFKPSAEYQNRRAATQMIFEARSEAARKAIVEAAQEGAPGHPGDNPNPYFFIQDFPEPTPTNLNGTIQGEQLLNARQAKTAFYNGKWGLYSLEDIQLFNLKTLN